MTDFLTSYLLTVVITCGAGALLWAGESLFPGRIPAGLRKVLWFLLLARLALPLGLRDPADLFLDQRPTLPAASTAIRHVPLPVTLPSAKEGVEALEPLEDRVAGELISSSPTEPLSAFPWAAVVLGILYFAGFGSLLARRIHSSLKLNHMLKEGRENPGDGSALLDGVKHRWNLSGPLSLRLVPGINSPALVGLIKPRILLPAGLEETFSPQEREIMLDHEAAHLRAGDPWWILAADLITLALWFLPPVWIFRGRLVAALEESCDRRVLERRREITPQDYGLTLLKVLSTPAATGAPLPAMASPRRLVKARIRLIAQPKQASLLLTALAMVALLGACSLGVKVKMEPPMEESVNQQISSPEVLKPEEEAPPPLQTNEQKILETEPKKAEALQPLKEEVTNALSPPRITSHMGWVWPLGNTDFTISNYHGASIHPFTGTWFYHKGLDLAAPQGSPVLSPGTGTVQEADYDQNGYGNYMDLLLDNGYKIRFAHLSKVLINKGDQVTIGQIIGLVGSTGYSTGPHLHFEVHQDTKLINPHEFYAGLLPNLEKKSDWEAIRKLPHFSAGNFPRENAWWDPPVQPIVRNLVYPGKVKPEIPVGTTVIDLEADSLRSPVDVESFSYGFDPNSEKLLILINDIYLFSGFSVLPPKEVFAGLKAGDPILQVQGDSIQFGVFRERTDPEGRTLRGFADLSQAFD